MPIALTPNKKWDYVLREDRGLPPDKQTIFKLKALSSEEFFAIQNIQYTNGFGTANQSVLIIGLVGWENFLDNQGQAVPFNLEDGACAQENLDRLTPAIMMELIGAIRKRNELSEDEIKNSPSGDAS